MTRSPLVAARGIGWSVAGRRILGPIDLEIHRGERLVVVGPNGAGKTTLMRLLCGVTAADAGRLTWEGEAYADLSRRALARRVAYVPQVRPARIPLTVEQMTLLGRYPHLGRLQAAPRAEDFAAVERVLALVGLTHLRERALDSLSGGERQAVFIAAALAQEARLLVLDEPTTHLDPRHQREVARLVRRLGERGERTLVTATHDLHFAALVADRVLALRDGRVLGVGPPAERLNPEALAELFDAPFEAVRGGERPLSILELEA